MSEKHTIEQLQAMPHEQLAELAARLRRLTLDGIWLADSYFDKCDVNNYHFVLARAWNPAADVAHELNWTPINDAWMLQCEAAGRYCELL